MGVYLKNSLRQIASVPERLQFSTPLQGRRQAVLGYLETADDIASVSSGSMSWEKCGDLALKATIATVIWNWTLTRRRKGKV